MSCNTAIFYDVENIVGVGSKNSGKILEKIQGEIKLLFGERSIAIQRAYADWGFSQNRSLGKSILELGIVPIQIFNTNPCDKIKNAADVCLIIDAIDVLTTRTEIENFVITSGDGIFSFLAKTLHEHGKTVVGFGLANSNLIFMNACDKFINLQNILAMDKPSSQEKVKKMNIKTEEKTNSILITTSKPWIKDMDMTAQRPWTKNMEATTSKPISINSVLKPPVTTQKSHLNNINKSPLKLSANNIEARHSETQQQEQINNIKATKAQRLDNSAADTKLIQPTHLFKKPNPPKSFPKNEISKALLDSPLIPLKHDFDIQEALHMTRDIIQVMFKYKKEIELSLLKTYLDYFIGNFKNKKFGFKRFTDYVHYTLKDSPYYLDKKNTVFVVKMKNDSVSQVIPEELKVFQKELHFTWENQVSPDVKHNKDKKSSEGLTPDIDELIDDRLKPDRQEKSSNNLGQLELSQNESNQLNEIEVSNDEQQNKPESYDKQNIFQIDNLLDKSKFSRKDIKKALEKLISMELISKSEINKFTKLEYSTEILGINAPLLKEINEKEDLKIQRLFNGRKSYWARIFNINNTEYYIYMNWEKKYQDKFCDWLTKFT